MNTAQTAGIASAPAGTPDTAAADAAAIAQAQATAAAAAAAKAEADAKKAKDKADKKAQADLDKATKAADKAAAKAAADATKAADKLAKDAEKAKKKEDAVARKLASKMPTQNGVTRPKAETLCGQAWAAADHLSKQLGQPVPIAVLLEATNKAGLNEGNVKAEYARWRKFNGVTGRIVLPAPVLAPATTGTAEAQATA